MADDTIMHCGLVPEQNRRLMVAVCAELLAQGFTPAEPGHRPRAGNAP